jgi:hypothetical protein
VETGMSGVDPVALVVFGTAAAGTAKVLQGAGQRLGERIVDRIWPDRTPDNAAMQAAVANVEAMYARLQASMEYLQRQIGSGQGTEEAVLEALRNPDFSYAVHQALLAGARTDNTARHEVLSRAVVERIIAAPDSTQAVASSVAIEAIGRLSGPQMDLLGLAALLYYVAPVHHAPPALPDVQLQLPDDKQLALEIRRGAWRAEREAAERAVTDYLAWFESSLSQHGVPETITPLDYAHLASASCATFDRSLHRVLSTVLQGRDLEVTGEIALRNAYSIVRDAIDWPRGDEKLRNFWYNGLQHVTVTPAGLLIGAIVHQLRTGESLSIRWDVGPVDIYIDERAWDGRSVPRKLYEHIRRKLEGDWSHRVLAGGHVPWDRGG